MLDRPEVATNIVLGGHEYRGNTALGRHYWLSQSHHKRYKLSVRVKASGSEHRDRFSNACA